MKTEPLEQTPIPLSPLPALETGRQLSRILRQRDFVVRALSALAVLGLTVALVLGVAIVIALRQRIQFVGLTPDGTVILTSGIAVDDARELQAQMAKLATAVLLSRGPQDMDFADFLPRLFSRPAQVLVEQLRQNEQSEFAQRQWRQKPEIFGIEVLELRGASVSVLVTGELIRTGPFAGQPLDHQVPFTLRLTLVRNPDLLRGARHPLVVVAFDLKYDPPRP